jgi:fatty-acyl-CoA synthase
MAPYGDAARVDEDGFYWIVDRVADRFVTEGQTVYPGEIERVLMEHPAIAEAGAVGIPHKELGEVGAVLVVPAEGAQVSEQELLGFSRQRLAAHQVPLAVTIVDHLPRNSVGKLIRDELRATAQAASQPRWSIARLALVSTESAPLKRGARV